MKIIIIGCGRVGSNIASKLSENSHDVCIIDRNPLAFDKLPVSFNGRVILGTGIDEDILINAGIAEADVVISVAKGDNTNIMVAQIAKFIFNIPNVVARIVDPKSKEFYSKKIGLRCYCPTEISSNYYLGFLGGMV